MEYKEEDYLQLSGIQHFLFCRRQWALIHIEQQWADNYQTADGIIMHKNTHDNRSKASVVRRTPHRVRGLKFRSDGRP